MSFKKTLIAVSLGVMLSGSAFASTKSVSAAIAAAEAANKAAAAVGYEWRDTAKMIKKAKMLARKGKTAAAIKLARQAETQGHNAVAQYKSESKRYAARFH